MLTLTEAVAVLNARQHRGHGRWSLHQLDNRPESLSVVGPDWHDDCLSPLEAIAIAEALQAGRTEESVMAEAEAEPEIVRLREAQAAALAAERARRDQEWALLGATHLERERRMEELRPLVRDEVTRWRPR